MKDSVAYELMEIAFFQDRTSHADLAGESFNLAAGLLGKPPLSGKADFNAALQGLNGDRYDFIQRRYLFDPVSLQGGTYKMQDKYETTVSDFKMGRIETTVWQYNLFCVAMGHDITQRTGSDGTTLKESKFQLSWGWIGDHPVVEVSWYDAVAYANWLSKKMGLSPAYEIKMTEKDSLNTNDYDDFRWTVTPIENANGYRLPTEAEWEYAAQGGAMHEAFVYSGSNTLEEVAWYNVNSDSHTHPVGGKKANGAGLFDMSGNVREWCFDWYRVLPAETLRGAKSGSFRVLLGGAWSDANEYGSVSRRYYYDPWYRYDDVGFRLAQDK